jgi:hypothetical protein
MWLPAPAIAEHHPFFLNAEMRRLIRAGICGKVRPFAEAKTHR